MCLKNRKNIEVQLSSYISKRFYLVIIEILSLRLLVFSVKSSRAPT
jgi:hypothetical protein